MNNFTYKFLLVLSLGWVACFGALLRRDEVEEKKYDDQGHVVQPAAVAAQQVIDNVLFVRPGKRTQQLLEENDCCSCFVILLKRLCCFRSVRVAPAPVEGSFSQLPSDAWRVIIGFFIPEPGIPGQVDGCNDEHQKSAMALCDIKNKRLHVACVLCLNIQKKHLHSLKGFSFSDSMISPGGDPRFLKWVISCLDPKKVVELDLAKINFDAKDLVEIIRGFPEVRMLALAHEKFNREHLENIAMRREGATGCRKIIGLDISGCPNIWNSQSIIRDPFRCVFFLSRCNEGQDWILDIRRLENIIGDYNREVNRMNRFSLGYLPKYPCLCFPCQRKAQMELDMRLAKIIICELQPAIDFAVENGYIEKNPDYTDLYMLSSSLR
ncbi:MAG: hypothetical protein WCT20_02110 [Candidatus Babeliales bacterium]